MDHPDLTISNFIGKSIGLKNVEHKFFFFYTIFQMFRYLVFIKQNIFMSPRKGAGERMSRDMKFPT